MSGIVSNCNDRFKTPRDLITETKRIVYVIGESARIIDRLPVEITTE